MKKLLAVLLTLGLCPFILGCPGDPAVDPDPAPVNETDPPAHDHDDHDMDAPEQPTDPGEPTFPEDQPTEPGEPTFPDEPGEPTEPGEPAEFDDEDF